MNGFPAWYYHREHEPKLVYSQEELSALGDEWADSPAKFDHPESYKEHMEKWESKDEQPKKKPGRPKAVK